MLDCKMFYELKSKFWSIFIYMKKEDYFREKFFLFLLKILM